MPRKLTEDENKEFLSLFMIRKNCKTNSASKNKDLLNFGTSIQ